MLTMGLVLVVEVGNLFCVVGLLSEYVLSVSLAGIDWLLIYNSVDGSGVTQSDTSASLLGPSLSVIYRICFPDITVAIFALNLKWISN